MSVICLPISDDADFGVTNKGVKPRKASDIIEQMEISIASRLGRDSYKLDFNQFTGAVLEGEAKQLEAIENLGSLLLAAGTLDYTFGVFMDWFAEPYGLTRNPATNSTTSDYQVKGITGILLPIGTIFKTSDDLKFQTTEEITLDSSIYIPVNIVSLETGDQNSALPNTVTTVEPANLNIIDAFNPTTIQPGKNTETDDEFRERLRASSRQTSGRSTNAIRSALLNVPTVFDAVVYENNDPVDDLPIGSFFLEPGHILPIVFGTGAQDIANAIFNNMSAGDPLDGDTVENAISDSGQTVPITWQQGTILQVYIKIVSNPPTTEVGEDIKNDIIANLQNYINVFLKAGITVDYEQIVSIVTVPYEVVNDTTEVYIGFSANPTGQVDLTLNIDENSNLQSSDVEFVDFN